MGYAAVEAIMHQVWSTATPDRIFRAQTILCPQDVVPLQK